MEVKQIYNTYEANTRHIRSIIKQREYLNKEVLRLKAVRSEIRYKLAIHSVLQVGDNVQARKYNWDKKEHELCHCIVSKVIPSIREDKDGNKYHIFSYKLNKIKKDGTMSMVSFNSKYRSYDIDEIIHNKTK